MLNTSNRYFLNAPESSIENGDRSTIQDHLRNYNVLETFKELRLKNLCFRKRKIDSEDESEEEDQLHIVYNTRPPPIRIVIFTAPFIVVPFCV